MKYLDEFRDPELAKGLAASIARSISQPRVIMEVCGGQTHAIMRFGIDTMLPPDLELLHGPGCPVCVTPIATIDHAIAIALERSVILCSFGDMLRVPGHEEDLLSAKAKGADVRIVYSPLDALAIARAHPQKQVVFFAVGFETTAPANAMAVYQAAQSGLENFSILASHVLVPPAIEALLKSPENRVQGFLAAGHVCTIMGFHEYEFLAEEYRIPIVVTGFEPIDILQGLALCVEQLEQGRHCVENQYSRSVNRLGNEYAVAMIKEVFEIAAKEWRGLGEIDKSGLVLREKYAKFDAARKFPKKASQFPRQASPCISGLILQGLKKPNQCPEFGKTCTPEKPLGATMVSSEGACAAYYRYRRMAS